ncbi:MAG: CBS domain-containing protein [Zetaproteobacteria bacterium]|nr:MAG: CBS domain-containing protein [Zetaproteobacteria bacterium]
MPATSARRRRPDGGASAGGTRGEGDMDADGPVFDEDSRYDQEDVPAKTIDARLFAEPIKNLHRRAGRVTVPPGTTIGDAARVMKEHRVGCVLVEGAGKIVGIFTERDILTKLVGTGYDPATTAVDDVMTRNPETLTPEDPIAFALQRMSVGGFRHVPLVDADGRSVGILSVKDIVDYLAEHFPEEILNIPPEPGRQPRTPEGG